MKAYPTANPSMRIKRMLPEWFGSRYGHGYVLLLRCLWSNNSLLKLFQISNLGLKKMKQGLSPGMDLNNIEVSLSRRRWRTSTLSSTLSSTFATGIPQHSSCSKGHSRQSRKMQPLQLCTNAVRKTKSQDKVAFWRLLTSSRQSRPADSLTVRHGWKRLADKYPDVGSSFLHKVKRVASKRRKGADTLTLRSHSGSASSTKTMEEEMETQRHRDTNCQGYRQDTDCQGIGPESVLCFLFI